MIEGKGKSVYSSIAIGKIFVFGNVSGNIREEGAGIEEEKELFAAARCRALEELDALYESALSSLGEEQAAIIDIQRMLLDDPDYIESIEALLNEGKSAVYSVRTGGYEQADLFAALDDEYMKERALDIRDVTDRLVGILSDSKGSMELKEKCILVAEDLTPSQTIALDKSKILAFVTRGGSSNSHTAILARVLNIPSLVQADIEISYELNGREMVVDGYSGSFYIDPTDEVLATAREKKDRELKESEELERYRGVNTVTRSGRKIELFANIASPDDLPLLEKGDAEGIGLLRSEFLYLGRSDYPSEEELFESYKKIVSALNGRKVVIRTLDIGADKKVDYFKLPAEENPALGYRGIRICLTDRDVFRTQMRAIYRASAYGRVAVMFPMIISTGEVEEIKSFCSEIMAELDRDGIPYSKDVELGIMIETPAAAIISDELAAMVDFFSVGTNDLTQYTLAIDRQNERLDRFYDSHHPALLRLLAMIARNANEKGIWAGICGELAADPALTDEFIRMGFSELSVAPSRILSLRKNIVNSEV